MKLDKYIETSVTSVVAAMSEFDIEGDYKVDFDLAVCPYEQPDGTIDIMVVGQVKGDYSAPSRIKFSVHIENKGA